MTGSLLLPGTLLPLNVFEPRYRNMVRDASEGAGHIGMIQPLLPMPDNWGAIDLPERPELYEVGCAGSIERCEEQDDGRYLILLRGVSRFRIVRELGERRGYRRVEASYDEFGADLVEPEAEIDSRAVLAAARHLGDAEQLDFDFDLLAAVPGISLLNGLCVALPFAAGEKQALLEASTPQRRQELFLALVGMGLDSLDGEELPPPPLIN